MSLSRSSNPATQAAKDGIRPSVILTSLAAFVAVLVVVVPRVRQFYTSAKVVNPAPVVVSEPLAPAPPPSSVQPMGLALQPQPLPPAPYAPEVMLQRFGIEVAGVFIADGGASLQLRYKVDDVQRSANILKQRTRVGTLIDEETGARFLVANPTLGGAFLLEGEANTTGSVMALPLPNPKGQIKAGSKVTVAMGALVLEHLEVQ